MREATRLPWVWIRDGRMAWVLILAATLVLLALAGASISDYGSVAQAHALTTVTPQFSANVSGASPSGVLGDGDVLTGTLRITVTNPSPRVLDFDSVSYKAWIEDLPAEAGLAGLGRSDQVLVNETGTHLFFLAFSGSLNVPPSPVPAGGEATLPLVLNLTQSSDPTAFAAVQNITSYAAAVRGDAWGIPWTVWVQLALPIEGVPPASLSAATYLFDVGRVVISGGTNLGS